MTTSVSGGTRRFPLSIITLAHFAAGKCSSM
jgi:hypothetical protein